MPSRDLIAALAAIIPSLSLTDENPAGTSFTRDEKIPPRFTRFPSLKTHPAQACLPGLA